MSPYDKGSKANLLLTKPFAIVIAPFVRQYHDFRGTCHGRSQCLGLENKAHPAFLYVL